MGNGNQNIIHNKTICEEIKSIKIYANKGRDYWHYNDSSDGQYIFKQTWNYIRVKQNECSWKNLVWHKIATPKLNVCLYRAYNNYLPIKSKFMNHGFLNCNKCVLCIDKEETNTHLFFECVFSNYIWCWVRVKMSSPILQTNHKAKLAEEINHILDNFKQNDLAKKIIIAALACTVWQIWKERNFIEFKNEHTDAFKVCEKIKIQVLDMLQFRSKTKMRITEKTRRIMGN